MPDVAFKDVCLDAHQPRIVGSWWAALLGQDLVVGDDGDCWLTDGPAMWINPVPEELGPSRVRLQARGPVAEAVVRTDPEGLEVVVHPDESALLVAAADPLALARWWAERTGATVVGRADGVDLDGVPGLPYDRWAFVPADGPKTVKNRVHWDVTVVDGSIEGLVAAGARVVDVQPRWTVLADPEGNEHCVFSPAAPAAAG